MLKVNMEPDMYRSLKRVVDSYPQLDQFAINMIREDFIVSETTMRRVKRSRNYADYCAISRYDSLSGDKRAKFRKEYRRKRAEEIAKSNGTTLREKKPNTTTGVMTIKLNDDYFQKRLDKALRRRALVLMKILTVLLTILIIANVVLIGIEIHGGKI